MARVKLTLMYDGTPFHGWQVQPGKDTVQKRMCDALGQIYGQPIAVTGCSRTDAGVHALGYVCHFDSPGKISPEISAKKLPAAINAHLPREISVKLAELVRDDFHARYDVINKTYRYLIVNSRERNPFYSDRAEQCRYALDIEKMQKEAQSLLGEHDFSSFMAAGSKIENPVRTIFSSGLEVENELLTFEICGNGFLYNMVRIISGTLLDIGRGKITLPMSDIISARNRSMAGYTAPACGLYLKKVFY